MSTPCLPGSRTGSQRRNPAGGSCLEPCEGNSRFCNMSFHKDTVWCFRVYVLNFRVLGASQGFEAQGLRGLAMFGAAVDSYP